MERATQRMRILRSPNFVVSTTVSMDTMFHAHRAFLSPYSSKYL